ncbi:MAG: DUF4168 domain-containing protein [Spirochaetota bacterium]
MKIKTVCSKNSWRKFFIFMVVLSFMFAAGNVIAQEEQYQQQQQQQQQTDFSEKELEKFAKAFIKIRDIQEEYSNALSEAENEQEAQELQGKYMDKMIKVVRDEGLSVEKYNQITRALQSDPEIKEEIMELVESLS